MAQNETKKTETKAEKKVSEADQPPEPQKAHKTRRHRFAVAIPDMASVAARKLGGGVAGGTRSIGSYARSSGVNSITQNIIRGYFTTKLAQLRPDQLHTLLSSGAYLADLIDGNNKTVSTPIRLISRFMSREKMIQTFDGLVTPEIVARMLYEGEIVPLMREYEEEAGRSPIKEGSGLLGVDAALEGHLTKEFNEWRIQGERITAYERIMTHPGGGEKWLLWQGEALKRKLIEMMES